MRSTVAEVVLSLKKKLMTEELPDLMTEELPDNWTIQGRLSRI